MKYKTLMSQPEYAKAREFAAILNSVVKTKFIKELKGVKRYVDPRVKGVSTKYMDVDELLANRLVKFISDLPIPEGLFKIRAERVNKGYYTSVRLSVQAV